MSKKAFGTTSKGVEASLYEISNGGELRVLLTDYGAADRKSTRLNSSHYQQSRMPSSA